MRGEIGMKKLLNNKFLSKHNIVKIGVVLLLVAVIGYSAIALASNYADINKLNSQLTQAEETYNSQIAENDRIKAILNSDNKDEYIEQKAREKGYVKSGETVFYDISSSK